VAGRHGVILAGRLLLPTTVELIPVDALPPGTRAQFTHTETDFILTRTHARDISRVVDASTAAFLSCFRVARTVADAVIEYSHTAGADPESLLMDAWPLITQLVDDRLLVSEDDPADDGPASRLAAGARVEDWTIVRRVQALDDTEVWQAADDTGQWYALKASRCPPESAYAQWIAHEADVLEHLDGSVSPRLRGRGTIGESPFLVLDWRAGSNIDSVAVELRTLPSDERRAALLRLGIALLDSYARLHAQGVVHGDIHTRNVLMDRDGRVTVLDFALARRIGTDGDDVPRAGVAFYFEPELADASLAGLAAPPATAAGEQFALAALLYVLFTGEHYQDFQLEQRAFLRAVREGAVLAFAARGVEPWPDVEETFARALSKAPGDRFPSVAAFAARLREIQGATAAPGPDAAPDGRHDVGRHPRYAPDDAQRMLLGGLLTRAGYGCRDAPAPVSAAPVASVMHGAAGLAYALYRLALVRDDAEMLTLADLWASRAIAAADDPRAFSDESRGLTRAIYSAATPYHTIAGVHSVRALIANAAGDHQTVLESVDAYISHSVVPADGANLDLMLGHSGVLIASALLLDALAPVHATARARLGTHGAAVLRAIDDAARAQPAMRDSVSLSATGAAHGWTGALYAMLRWCGAERRPVTEETVRRLQELAGHGEPWGRGVRWPHSLDPQLAQRRSYLPGWCNGTAGLVHLWTLAARLTGDATFGELADRAAWSTWEHASDSITNICCGLAGMGYALLVRYRATEDHAWFRRAASLSSRAARVSAADPPPNPDSLYHGTVGIALLVADLERPRLAAMPFFGDEGWQWDGPPIANGGAGR
jgi:serine/threonine-protein kinase